MEIRPYYKGELAQLYFRYHTQQSAVNRLNAWIHLNTELYDALLRSGYKSRQRTFTSYQVRLIVEFLGEP